MGEGGERETTERTGVVRTVLFADVADSSSILVAGGDANAHTMMRQCLARMMEAAAEHDGEVVDEKGDEVLCIFVDPTRASRAAAEMQVRIAALSQEHPELPRIALRIGFEHGPLIQTDDGVFGTTIYSAARLVALAKGGQVLTTRETLDQISTEAAVATRFFALQVLRGQPQEREVLELLWDTGNSTAWVSRSARAGGSRIERVEIEFDGATYRVDASSPRLEFGRNPNCDVSVVHEAVSRLHARLSWNSGRTQIEDLSTNGTLIEPEGGTVVPLHHDKMGLSGRGVVRLGTLEAGVDAPAVAYRCLDSSSG